MDIVLVESFAGTDARYFEAKSAPGLRMRKVGGDVVRIHVDDDLVRRRLNGGAVDGQQYVAMDFPIEVMRKLLASAELQGEVEDCEGEDDC